MAIQAAGSSTKATTIKATDDKKAVSTAPAGKNAVKADASAEGDEDLSWEKVEKGGTSAHVAREIRRSLLGFNDRKRLEEMEKQTEKLIRRDWTQLEKEAAQFQESQESYEQNFAVGRYGSDSKTLKTRGQLTGMNPSMLAQIQNQQATFLR